MKTVSFSLLKSKLISCAVASIVKSVESQPGLDGTFVFVEHQNQVSQNNTFLVVNILNLLLLVFQRKAVVNALESSDSVVEFYPKYMNTSTIY